MNELVPPNFNQTSAIIRKLADAPASVAHLTFKSQEYDAGLIACLSTIWPVSHNLHWRKVYVSTIPESWKRIPQSALFRLWDMAAGLPSFAC